MLYPAVKLAQCGNDSKRFLHETEKSGPKCTGIRLKRLRPSPLAIRFSRFVLHLCGFTQQTFDGDGKNAYLADKKR